MFPDSGKFWSYVLSYSKILHVSVFSIPWCVPSGKITKGARRKKDIVSSKSAFGKNITQILDLLHEAFQNGKMFGSPNILYDICNNMALFSFMKAYLLDGMSESGSKELALSVAFYLGQFFISEKLSFHCFYNFINRSIKRAYFKKGNIRCSSR